jgi:hypothetical protein
MCSSLDRALPASNPDIVGRNPQVLEQTEEGEHYQWFVRNDKESNRRKEMPAIGRRELLPRFERYPKPLPRERR